MKCPHCHAELDPQAIRAEFARLGGKATSPAKARASRLNGRKGGYKRVLWEGRTYGPLTGAGFTVKVWEDHSARIEAHDPWAAPGTPPPAWQTHAIPENVWQLLKRKRHTDDAEEIQIGVIRWLHTDDWLPWATRAKPK